MRKDWNILGEVIDIIFIFLGFAAMYVIESHFDLSNGNLFLELGMVLVFYIGFSIIYFFIARRFNLRRQAFMLTLAGIIPFW